MLLGGAPAFAATPSTPAGGSIRIYAVPNGNGGGPIVITGAIGDYGRTLTINKNGTPDPNNGNYVKVTLHKGTFEVNKTTRSTRRRTSLGSQTRFDKATCSMAASVSASHNPARRHGPLRGDRRDAKRHHTEGFILPCNDRQGQGPVQREPKRHARSRLRVDHRHGYRLVQLGTSEGDHGGRRFDPGQAFLCSGSTRRR